MFPASMSSLRISSRALVFVLSFQLNLSFTVNMVMADSAADGGTLLSAAGTSALSVSGSAASSPPFS